VATRLFSNDFGKACSFYSGYLLFAYKLALTASAINLGAGSAKVALAVHGREWTRLLRVLLCLMWATAAGGGSRLTWVRGTVY